MGATDDKKVKLLRKRLDRAGVLSHLAELQRNAQSIELRVKGVEAGYSEETINDFNELGRQLIEGELVAVQLRFHLDEAWWCDTLMRDRDHFRLVRMRQEL